MLTTIKTQKNHSLLISKNLFNRIDNDIGMKRISIMITSYNLVDYIDESLQSVVNQVMPCDWELLIGDDGSTDGTIEKLEVWSRKYPDHIRYRVNERPLTKVKDGYRAGKNRASLLECATGDYLIFLDGDDCWLGTEKLMAQYAVLQSKENEDCSCCAHNILGYVIPENKKYNMVDGAIPTRKFTTKEYWPTMYFHTNTILFRKECKELLLNPLYRDHLNDNFITFILLQYGNVYYLNKVWAQYNMTGEGLWTGNGKVYGYFRNITLYDMERQINPGMYLQSFRRHLGDFAVILKEYNRDDFNKLLPILHPLDPKRYRYTFAMAHMYDDGFRGMINRLFILWQFIYGKFRLRLAKYL